MERILAPIIMKLKLELIDSIILKENCYIIKIKVQCPECLSYNRKQIEDGNLTTGFFYCKFCNHLIMDDNKQISEVIREEIERWKRSKMDIPVEESMSIPDGIHKGEIVDIKQRDYPTYSYIDFIMTVDKLKNSEGKQITLKAGFPLPATVNSSLGKFLTVMGFNLVAGKKLKDVEKELMGKKIQYQTNQEQGKDGNIYSNILKNTIKPM